jgi:hypothetical protein
MAISAFAVLALAVLAMPTAAPAPLAAQGLPSVPREVFRDQPPMSDEDVPTLVEFAIFVDANQELMWDRIIAGRFNSEDERRLFYLIVRYVTGVYMVDPKYLVPAEEAVNMFGPLALPLPEELDVTRRHFESIEKARQDAREEKTPRLR